MSISQLPPEPDRADPSTFASRADAFVAALSTFRTEANDLAVDVNADATTAASSAASVDADKWVSGGPFAEGDVRWSPIDFKSYRAKQANTSTTDPSADSTNWALVSGNGDLSAQSAFFLGSIKETVYSITDGASVEIDPANGTWQTWVMGADRTPTLSLDSGQYVVVFFDGGAGPYTPDLSAEVDQWIGSQPGLSNGSWTPMLFINLLGTIIAMGRG